ncbi:MAG: YebC/PmpR family DNA-binding transcriptional regulator [Candidatus Jacksonbacteria bacterium]|nr:YebC/PmpR family DNA-binding transcriptional regulator [Candidatus Jacksonbacteria bacterium]MBT6034786.1 YebC/PmpR family DNA-binding transcriptional regulator [Candidatus Jacksonbacteria bacterium]MBT6301092.1 YebC/PmpR family DNA-binding transcriptional regulator [Candidatus Jacksonbacteria bacterium]MBT6757524.1 YebC/PmpR family DNA-binding transcriptional regulator [Candidatus Jacksonbacteria bacterium]MBT6955601.1 YebC/PmpR family DNA-binding transcriptional regulator [Candidatus Jacks
MSGHSKWASIKHKKGAADQKRGKIFSKLSKAIIVAAKQGGGDPNTNLSLKLAIDASKSANMPKDNIQSAIDRATGNVEGLQIEKAMYEGFGPGGVAILVQAATDNKNRTLPNIRQIFTKYGGTLGAANSVAWMFEQKGVIRLEKSGVKDTDEFELQAIDAGAEDIKISDEDITVISSTSDLSKIKTALEEAGTTIEYAQLEYLPQQPAEIDQPTRDKVENMFEALDDDDDVTDFYSNLPD